MKMCIVANNIFILLTVKRNTNKIIQNQLFKIQLMFYKSCKDSFTHVNNELVEVSILVLNTSKEIQLKFT